MTSFCALARTRVGRLFGPAFEDQRGVGAAEAEGIGEGVGDSALRATLGM